MKIYETTYIQCIVKTRCSVLRTPRGRYAVFFHVGDFFHVFCNV